MIVRGTVINRVCYAVKYLSLLVFAEYSVASVDEYLRRSRGRKKKIVAVEETLTLLEERDINEKRRLRRQGGKIALIVRTEY